jgi:hypothetical protein
MKLLLWLFGWPHEMLHVLALRLIGRQPEAVTQSHVDIPDDLSTGEFVFVAGLPALVFWTAAAVSIQLLFSASTLPLRLLWLLLAGFIIVGGFGTVGDMLLIIARIMQARVPDDFE